MLMMRFAAASTSPFVASRACKFSAGFMKPSSSSILTWASRSGVIAGKRPEPPTYALLDDEDEFEAEPGWRDGVVAAADGAGADKGGGMEADASDAVAGVDSRVETELWREPALEEAREELEDDLAAPPEKKRMQKQCTS
jgi:hypothetical protein